MAPLFDEILVTIFTFFALLREPVLVFDFLVFAIEAPKHEKKKLYQMPGKARANDNHRTVVNTAFKVVSHIHVFHR